MCSQFQSHCSVVFCIVCSFVMFVVDAIDDIMDIMEAYSSIGLVTALYVENNVEAQYFGMPVHV